MKRLEISLRGKIYPIECADDESTRIQEVAAYIDARLKLLAERAPHATDNQLLVLNALMMADDLLLARQNGGPETISDSCNIAIDEKDQIILAAAVDYLTSRVESIAETLKSAA